MWFLCKFLITSICSDCLEIWRKYWQPTGVLNLRASDRICSYQYTCHSSITDTVVFDWSNSDTSKRLNISTNFQLNNYLVFKKSYFKNEVLYECKNNERSPDQHMLLTFSAVLIRNAVICYDYNKVCVTNGWASNTGGVILTRDCRSTRSNIPFQYHFIHLKSHVDWNRNETWPTNSCLSHRIVAATSYLPTDYYYQWRHSGVATTP